MGADGFACIVLTATKSCRWYTNHVEIYVQAQSCFLSAFDGAHVCLYSIMWTTSILSSCSHFAACISTHLYELVWVNIMPQTNLAHHPIPPIKNWVIMYGCSYYVFLIYICIYSVLQHQLSSRRCRKELLLRPVCRFSYQSGKKNQIDQNMLTKEVFDFTKDATVLKYNRARFSVYGSSLERSQIKAHRGELKYKKGPYTYRLLRRKGNSITT